MNMVQKCERDAILGQLRIARQKLDQIETNHWDKDDYRSSPNLVSSPECAAIGIQFLGSALLQLARADYPEDLGITSRQRVEFICLVDDLTSLLQRVIDNYPQRSAYVIKAATALENADVIGAMLPLMSGLKDSDRILRLTCADLLIRMAEVARNALSRTEQILRI
jgi:hypothetical protein